MASSADNFMLLDPRAEGWYTKEFRLKSDQGYGASHGAYSASSGCNVSSLDYNFY